MMEEENKQQQEQQENNQKQNIKLNDKVKSKVEEKIGKIIDVGIQSDNVDYLYKLIDIHKDIENEEYWKVKKEGILMRYMDYGREEYGNANYGRRGVPGTGRGYGDGSYRRRGVPGTGRGRYRGEYAIDEMKDYYMNYNDATDEMERGNYGAEGEMIKSVETIMENIYEIVQELSEANSPEVNQIIKKYSRKISEM